MRRQEAKALPRKKLRRKKLSAETADKTDTPKLLPPEDGEVQDDDDEADDDDDTGLAG